MPSSLLSLAAIILATAVTYTSSTLLTSQPQFILEAEENKAFEDSHLIGTFEINSGNMAECLEHCLVNCSCMSFQLCQNTTCQLCSTNKIETSSLLHDEDGCIYAIYKMQHLSGSFQRKEDQCSGLDCSMNYNITQPWKRLNTCKNLQVSNQGNRQRRRSSRSRRRRRRRRT